MATVPNIDRDAIVAGIKERLPSAAIRVEIINPQYASWTIDVRQNNRMASVAWGPLSGFGATGHQAYREDANPFGSHDWPLETAEQAVDFVVRHLQVSVA